MNEPHIGMARRTSGPFGSFVRWLPATLQVGVIVLPAVVLGIFIHDHQVNIPFLDDWMFVPMYEKASRGQLSLHDLFAVQMEHRLVVPRLILLGFQRILPGIWTAQNWLTFALLVASAANVAVLFRRASGRFAHWWIAMALCSVALFTPNQYQIVLWPMLFQVAIPVAALTTALAIVGSRWPVWFRFTICLLAALAGTLSYASGLLIWPLLLPVILCGVGFSSRKQRALFTVGWLLAAVVTFALYFHNLRNEADPAFAYGAGEGEDRSARELSSILAEPQKLGRFALIFLGGHLGRGTSGWMVTQSELFGGLSLALWAGAAAFWLARFRHDLVFRAAAVPWITLGAYSIATAVLVGVGRAWASKTGDNALNARYVIHTVPLTVSLIALSWLGLRRWGFRARVTPGVDARAPRVGWTVATVAASYCVWQSVQWIHGSAMMKTWESARLRGAASTLFFRLAGMIGNEHVIAGNAPLARRMDDLGLLKPAMLRDASLARFHVAKAINVGAADVTVFRPYGDQHFRVEGYATISNRERVADAIIFARRGRGEEWQIFHVCQSMEMPLTLAKSLGRDLRFVHHWGEILEQFDLGGFETELDASHFPGGPQGIMVAALDYKHLTLYPMARFTVDARIGTVKAERIVPPKGRLERKHRRAIPLDREKASPLPDSSTERPGAPPPSSPVTPAEAQDGPVE